MESNQLRQVPSAEDYLASAGQYEDFIGSAVYRDMQAVLAERRQLILELLAESTTWEVTVKLQGALQEIDYTLTLADRSLQVLKGEM